MQSPKLCKTEFHTLLVSLSSYYSDESDLVCMSAAFLVRAVSDSQGLKCGRHLGGVLQSGLSDPSSEVHTLCLSPSLATV